MPKFFRCVYDDKIIKGIHRTATQQHISLTNTIVCNLASFMHSLPCHSPYKQELIAMLSPHVSTKVLASVCNVSPSLVSLSRTANKHQLQHKHYPTGVKRQKLSTATMQLTQTFIQDYCPTKSGSATLVYYQYTQSNQLYSKYLHSFPELLASSQQHGAEPSTPICYHTFMKLKHDIHIRIVRGYYGQFDCPHCLKLRQLE